MRIKEPAVSAGSFYMHTGRVAIINFETICLAILTESYNIV